MIQAARAGNPNNLLIDCGDTIQGTPLEAVYQEKVGTVRDSRPHDPMMLAMNAIGYDAMVVGNHEFNFGLKNLAQGARGRQFPLDFVQYYRQARRSPAKPFAPYFLKTVAGVKIAVIGITTP